MPIEAKNRLAELVKRVAGRDEAALGELFDATGPRLLGVVRRFIADIEAAEETLLDVYAQVWRQAHRFDPKRGGVWSWLLTAARTRALDKLRSSGGLPGRGERFATDLGGMPEPAFEMPSGGEEIEEVRRALAGLPHDQRLAIEAAYFGGLSYTEAARELDLPEGTLKSRIRAGLLSLRRTLARRGMSPREAGDEG